MPLLYSGYGADLSHVIDCPPLESLLEATDGGPAVRVALDDLGMSTCAVAASNSGIGVSARAARGSRGVGAEATACMVAGADLSGRAASGSGEANASFLAGAGAALGLLGALCFFNAA